ncbi:MAG TPA: (deoxy)nucleoside triphosphate pyrophosphohydrolase [Nitrospiria bacterium]
MSDTDKRIEVAAGVIVEDGRYLITRRFKTAPRGGLWEFPGGKRHPGESLQDCLRRELKEELDITVDVGEELHRIRHAYPDCAVELHFYRCTILNGRPRSLGNEAYRWVPLVQLSEISFPEANRPFILELLNHP